MDEVDRQARRHGLSRSGYFQNLVAQEFSAIGKSKVIERAEVKTFAGD